MLPLNAQEAQKITTTCAQVLCCCMSVLILK